MALKGFWIFFMTDSFHFSGTVSQLHVCCCTRRRIERSLRLTMSLTSKGSCNRFLWCLCASEMKESLLLCRCWDRRKLVFLVFTIICNLCLIWIETIGWNRVWFNLNNRGTMQIANTRFSFGPYDDENYTFHRRIAGVIRKFYWKPRNSESWRTSFVVIWCAKIIVWAEINKKTLELNSTTGTSFTTCCARSPMHNV